MIQATPKDFRPTDPLLYHKGKSKWYRFVPMGDYISIFSGQGGLDLQTWEYIVTVNKNAVKSIWDGAVSDGFVRME